MEVLRLPKGGQAMDEGTVVEWHADVGERVAAGDRVVSVETEKTVRELPATADGVLRSIDVREGETVPVGTVLGRIGEPDEAGAAERGESTAVEGETAQAVDDEAATADGETGTDADDGATTADGEFATADDGSETRTVRATPTARRRAREFGVTVAAVAAAVGTVSVTPSDVERYATEKGSTDAGESVLAGCESAASSAPTGTDITQPRGATVLGTPRARVVANEAGVDVVTVGDALGVDRVRERHVRSYLDRGDVIDLFEDADLERPEPERSESADSEPDRPGPARLSGAREPPAVASEGALDGVRAVMFERMASTSKYADTTTVSRVDVTALTSLYERLATSWDGPASLTAFVVRAAALALSDYEVLNASVDESGTLTVYEDVNVGFAVNTDRGLLVPTISQADARTVRETSAEIDRLASDARAGSIEHEDLQHGTFTVSNAGSLGAYLNTPRINPPQTAILGVCTVFEQPAVVDGEVVPREMMHLCLTYDHRVIEGAEAVGFLQSVTERLEAPESLLS